VSGVLLEGLLESAGDFDGVTAVEILLASGRTAFLPVTIEVARELAKHYAEKVLVRVVVAPQADLPTPAKALEDPPQLMLTDHLPAAAEELRGALDKILDEIELIGFELETDRQSLLGLVDRAQRLVPIQHDDAQGGRPVDTPAEQPPPRPRDCSACDDTGFVRAPPDDTWPKARNIPCRACGKGRAHAAAIEALKP